jgi:ubiquinone/menaquinone biosynthesis methyltransferase
LILEIKFVCGNAEQLPFEDASFDVYTIAFGIRNVPRIDFALKEANRVLKRGGKFQCLEFSKVTMPGLSQLNHLYQFSVLPLVGQLIAKDREAYQYLVILKSLCRLKASISSTGRKNFRG